MDSEHVLRLKMEGLFWLGAVLRAEKFSQLRTRYSMNKLETLKSSKDFQRAKSGLFFRSRSFLLQAYEDKSCNKVRVGFTVSKQNGNAVVRNNKNNSDVRKSVDRIRNNDTEGPLAVNRKPDLLVESLKQTCMEAEGRRGTAPHFGDAGEQMRQ